MTYEPTPHEEPQRSISKPASRDALIKSKIERFEREMIEAQNAADNIKALTAECKRDGFSKEDIASIKLSAKLMANDKVDQAREKFRSLEYVSRVAGLDLFSWSEELSDR